MKLVDLAEKYMSGEKLDLNFDKAREMMSDKDCTLNRYINRLLDEVDPHVLKTAFLNLRYEAFF